MIRNLLQPLTLAHSIIEKLSELGWGDEIAKGQNRKRLSEHNLVTQKKELTDRGVCFMPPLSWKKRFISR